MNQALKQRLLGTLVLGSLALIFIPLLLDGEGISPTANIAAIPPEPIISSNQIAAPQTPQSVTPVDTLTPEETATAAAIELPVASEILQDEQLDTALANNNTSSTTPVLGVDGLPEAWTIRLGIFGERANAETLLRKLLDADYKAYSRPITTSQGAAMSGIFVGPVLTRAEAGTLVSELATKFKVNGIVVRFTIDAPQ